MAQDIFGRIVSIDENVSAIKAQLLQSVRTKTATSSSADDEPVEKLIKQIDTITGYKLDDELKKFKDSLAEIRKIYDEVAKKRNERRSSGSSGGLSSASDSLKKSLKKILKDTESGLANFGEKLNEMLESKLKGKGAGTDRIPGAPAAVRKSTKDLCACICECIKELKSGKGGRGKGRGRDFEDGGGGRDGRGGRRGWRPPMNREYARRLELAKAKGDEYDRGRGKGAYLPGRAAAGYERLKAYSTDSQGGKEAIVNDIVMGVSKGVGGVVGGLTSLLAGPLAGGFVGGFAEGLISLIFKPLADQFEALSQRATLIYNQMGSDAVEVAARHRELLFTNKDMLDTGVSLNRLDKQRNKNAKRGITDAKVLRTVTKTGLQLSSQIGSNAEETADMFAAWNTQLDLSGNKLNVISRNMLTIGRQTGLTGENLLKVAKESQSFMTNMRNAGTFTATAANNIIGLLARSEKTGTSPGMKNLLEVLKGSVLNASDQDTANLLLQAAGGDMTTQDKLTKGTALNDKRSLKVLGGGMRNLLQQVIGRFGATSMKQLTPEQAGEADLVMKGLTRGKYGAKEVELLSEQLEDLGKDFGEQIKDIDKNKKLTKSEKEIQKQDLTYNAAAASLSDFTDILERNGGNVGAAFAELKQRSTDVGPLLAQLGVDANKSGDAIGALIDVQHKQLMADAQKYKLDSKFAELGLNDELIKKAKGGDKEALSTLQEGFNEIQRRIAEEKRVGADPIAAIQRELESFMAMVQNEIAKLIIDNLPAMNKFLSENLPKIREILEKTIPEVFNFLKEWVPKIYNFFVDNWKEIAAISAVLLGALIAGKIALMVTGLTGIAGSLTGILTALAGAGGVIALLAVAVGGGYLIKKEMDKWDDTFNAQAQSFDTLAQATAKQGSERATKLTSGTLNNEQIATEKAEAEKRLAAIQAARKEMDGSNTLMTQRGLSALASVFSTDGEGKGGYHGVDNATFAAKVALGQGEREAKQALTLTKYAEAIAKAGTKEEKERLEEIALRDAYSDNLAVANIKLAKTMQTARDELKKGAEGLKEELDEAWKKSNERTGLGRGFTRLWHGTTAEEDKAGEILNKLGEQKAAFEGKTQELYEINKKSLQKKNEKGEMQYISSMEAAKRWQSVIKDTDQAALDQFKSAKTLDELNKQYEKTLNPIKEAYKNTKDNAEGVEEAIKQAEKGARTINSYEQVRMDLIKKMMKDEKGGWKSLADVTADFRKQENVGPVKEMVDMFGKTGSMAELDSVYKTVQASLQKEYDGAKTMKESARILEQSAKVSASYDQAKYVKAKDTMVDKVTGKYASFEDAATRYRSEILKPGDMNQAALDRFKTAKNQEELDKMLSGVTNPLKEQYDKTTGITDSLALLEKQAKILAAYEEVKKGLPVAKAQTAGQATPIDTTLQGILDAVNRIAESSDTLVEKMNALGVMPMKTMSPSVSASLPGVNVEEEINKRRMASGAGTNEIVANTGETAENTRRTAVLMGALLNCFRRAGRANRTAVNIEGENLDESAFFEQFIDCEWVDTQARSPSYVWKQGNIGKKN